MLVQKYISFDDFINRFKVAGRGNQFSYEAFQALYNYYNEDPCDEIDMDVIAICCAWSEEPEKDIKVNYNIDAYTDVLDYINDNSIGIGLYNGKILYINF